MPCEPDDTVAWPHVVVVCVSYDVLAELLAPASDAKQKSAHRVIKTLICVLLKGKVTFGSGCVLHILLVRYPSAIVR